MSFTFDPPSGLIYVVVGLAVAVLGSLVLSRRSPARKIVGFVVAAAMVGVLLTRSYRISTSSLTIDDDGIVADIETKGRISWTDVGQAIYLPDVSASKYRPTRPTSPFTALGSLKARYGWYRLINGDRALFAVERPHGPGVAIVARDTIYVLAPNDVQGLAKAVAAHVPLAGWNAAQ